MALHRSLPPVWLLGFGFLPLGVNGSIMLITLPQLLAADHVPEVQIAAITSLALAPGFFSFLLAPLLDWRFARRSWAIALSVLSAAATVAALLLIKNLSLLPVAVFVSSFSAYLVAAAAGGWFGNLIQTGDKMRLGAWLAVANIASGGVAATVAIPLLRDLPYALGAGLLGLLLLSATPVFWFTRCPPADGRLARESFADFARDVAALMRRPSVLWTLFLFVTPATSFALTNILGGLGHDFHTSEKMVGLLGGVGVTLAGIGGSLLIPRLSPHVAPRPLYLWVGGVGALFSLGLTLAPRSPAAFGLALMGENVFQAAAFSVSNLIILRTIGEDNPLAATQFGLLMAASSAPLTYMQILDGQAYGLGGANGAFTADALVSGGVCLALAAILFVLRRRIPVV